MPARLALAALLLASTACAAGRDGRPPLQVVPAVDLGRYVGEWHEIARFPHRFQEGCFASRATYALSGDGKIDVLNQCRVGSPGGKIRSARGKAWVVDPATSAKLRVSFFWPFAGDYWIIDLGEDYEYAVVGHPDRTHLWILARAETLDGATYAAILERLAAQGYDTANLIRAGATP